MNEYQYYFDVPIGEKYDFKDKERDIRNHVLYMLARTQSMFKWDGLPDTIPQRVLETMLQCFGAIGFVPYKGEYYAMRGALGGPPDYNYMPTIFTVSNPALQYSANLKINDECIIMRNDDMYIGLIPMFSRNASALVENELSMYIADINARIISILSAQDDATKASAEVYLKHIYNGDLGVIGENQFMDGIRVQPYGTGQAYNALKDMIEYEQYIKASWFNELGLDANYNMKRETLTDSENEMNKDSLLPLIDDMLACRKEACEKINDKYGLNLSVEFNSAWHENAVELELQHDIMKEQADQINNDQESEPESESESESESEQEENKDDRSDEETE